MKILFDYQVFSRQHHGGASRYFAELINGLPQYENVETNYIAKFIRNEYLQKGSNDAVRNKSTLRTSWNSKVKNALLQKLKTYKTIQGAYDNLSLYCNTKLTIQTLHKNDYDVFHPTGFNPYFLNHVDEKPFVITIHDMTHELYPQWFKNVEKSILNKKILAEKAARIIAISENTKKDIISILGIHPNKIDVIHHANSLKTSEQSPVSIPGKYILFVGGRGEYKNFMFFLEAIAPLLLSEKVHLFCAGGGSFVRAEIEIIEKYKLKDFVVQQRVTDAELAYLYTHAINLAYPSLYEGFGIPILEAFACNCPVLLSNASCFPEIAGDAGLYFEADDLISTRSAQEKLLKNRTLRDSLRKLGKEQAKKYSWNKVRTQTLETYKKAIHEKKN